MADDEKTYSLEDLTPQRIEALVREADDRLWWEDSTRRLKERLSWVPWMGSVLTAVIMLWVFGRDGIVGIARWIVENIGK